MLVCAEPKQCLRRYAMAMLGQTCSLIVTCLGGGFKDFLMIFYFHPYLGKIPILTNIFQMG